MCPLPRIAYVALSGLLIVLASCGSPSASSPNSPTGNPTPQPPEIINGYVVDGYMTAVSLAGQLNGSNSLELKAQMEAQYGGKVLVWDEDAEDPYCVVMVNRASTSSVGALGSEGESRTVPNLRQFANAGQRASMNGASFWQNGASFWQNGASFWQNGANFWQNGGYQGMLENTQNWKNIDLEGAFRRAPRLGAGVKVAVVDTGLDFAHFAFQGLGVLAPASEMWDFVGDDPFPQEEGEMGKGGYGHGSSVAGVIRQIAPRASILPLRVLDKNGEGNTLNIMRAIYRAIRFEADIINLSLGSEQPSPELERAIRAATRRGIFVTISVGNDGAERVLYPAFDSCEDCTPQDFDPLKAMRVTVGSVDGQKRLSNFSNRNGQQNLLELRAEIGAPGEMVFGPAPGNRKAAWSGTSQAAPVVAGVLALALGEGKQETLEGRLQLIRRLKQSASCIQDSPTAVLGAGLLDAESFFDPNHSGLCNQ